MNGRKFRQMLLTTRSVALFGAVFWCPYGHAVEQEATGHVQEHEQEHEAPNEIAISLGLVHEGRENDSAAGLEYERRFTEKFGAGLLVERVWGNHEATIYALPLIRHAGRWKFFLAPGIEESHGHSEDLVRLGAGYEFEAGSARIIPTMAVDFVGGETIYVLSVALGMGF